MGKTEMVLPIIFLWNAIGGERLWLNSLYRIRTVMRLHKIVSLFTLLLLSLPLATSAQVGFVQKGEASYYASQFHGRPTASGERYNKNLMTASHKKLPFGTKVKVTNLANKKSVTVRINDRGPYVPRRIIDVSLAAATKLDMLRSGIAPVKIEVIGRIRRQHAARLTGR